MTNPSQHKTVVVGVGESARSRSAIRLAAEEADYRGADLIAVMTYSGERVLGAPAGRPVVTLSTVDDERIVTEAALRDAVYDALGDQAENVQLHAVFGEDFAEFLRRFDEGRLGPRARSAIDADRIDFAHGVILIER